MTTDSEFDPMTVFLHDRFDEEEAQAPFADDDLEDALAAVERKRSILAAHPVRPTNVVLGEADDPHPTVVGDAWFVDDEVFDLAAEYKDHPDYPTGWRRQ